MEQGKVSIIIPTYNRTSVLEQTLEQIQNKSAFALDRLEIIIVNDGEQPIDFLEKKYSALPLKVVKNKKQGAASARNLGAAHAKHTLLLFIDDDILIEPNHIDKHLKAHQKFSNALITANRIEQEIDDRVIKNSSFARYKVKYDYVWHDNQISNHIGEGYIEMPGMATFSCSVQKKEFDQIGGFDEDFPFAGREDSDFFCRAKKMKYRLIFDSKNNCFHNEPFNFNLEKWLWRHYTGTLTYVLFCHKHPEHKSESFYQMNLPSNSNDLVAIKLKKSFRRFFSTPLFRRFFLKCSLGLEKLYLPDKLMFKCYNLLFILYSQSGFIKGLEYVAEKKKSLIASRGLIEGFF